VALTSIVTIQPTLNIIKDSHKEDCRCVILQVRTECDVLQLQFENIQDLKAFHGLLGFALER
jgi:hypothetical protein